MVNISPSRSSDDNVVYIGEKKDNWYILDKQTGMSSNLDIPHRLENFDSKILTGQTNGFIKALYR